ncbi:hypothetical protein MNB_SV-15-1146 [hydrothermal vent metagenome]|uniref:Lipid/polyisoprenoid-binding YceI-like domain-containing protein n=1 Tax=hydrothermal vent metagenome TaxID=652676 RepID=A0A1W1EL46_9ZZZZ
MTQSNDLNISWKAYKTFAKVGVKGKFNEFKYISNAKEGKNFRELLVGSKVVINKSKIDTNNPSRDKTIVDKFFNQLNSDISGKIIDIKADENKNGKRAYSGSLDVNITMNEKTLTIPMRYNYKNEKFSATGVIDIFDFNGQNALSSINKSCYLLHKGKTWSDVTIRFETNIKASLCNAKIKKVK